jgi:hypothetical protein
MKSQSDSRALLPMTLPALKETTAVFLEKQGQRCSRFREVE